MKIRLTLLLTFRQLYLLSRSEAVVEPIHQALSSKSLLPEEHLMDLGYITAGHLVSSQENYGIELIVPVRNDPTWQAKHHPKFANSNFQIDCIKRHCSSRAKKVGWRVDLKQLEIKL